MLIRIHLFALMLLLSHTSGAAALKLTDEHERPIGEYAQVMTEVGMPLSLEQARRAYIEGRFSAGGEAYLNFGIGASPSWLRFELFNPTTYALEQWLSIETSWLDRVDVYLLRNGELIRAYRMGDAINYLERPVNSRFFVLAHDYEPGQTVLYLRVATADPMVLPIYLSDSETLLKRHQGMSFHYGFVYGVILALLLYNLVLYFGIRNSRYLYYSVYLALFLLMNLSYTGHAYHWLWPDSPTMQLWGNPLLMVAYAASGLLFATRFLDTKAVFPRLHRYTILVCWVFSGALGLAMVAGGHTMALFVAFTFVLFYTFGMILLGAVALYAGNQSAKYFLYASISAAIGATFTALTVWGIAPYSPYGYHAVEFGTMIEAILLALALADLFRRSQEGRIQAEQMARQDMLTGLNNRRAFSELVARLWQLGLRNNHPMTVLLLDIDRFKHINDTFGHAQGDTVLKQVARAIASVARTEDVLARWGGEEFILFMPETTLEQAVAVAERIRTKIEALRFDLNGKSSLCTASLGVAQLDKHTDSLDSLISRADKYLYRAKVSGRNRVCSALEVE